MTAPMTPEWVQRIISGALNEAWDSAGPAIMSVTEIETDHIVVDLQRWHQGSPAHRHGGGRQASRQL